MSVVSGAILLVLLVLVVLGPRRWALLALMVCVFFLTQGHAIDVAGLSLFPIRILGIAAMCRVLLRGEVEWSQFNRLDWTLLLSYNYMAAVWILRSAEFTPQRVGSAFDPTLCYIALRGLLRSLDDLRWLLKALALLLIPLTALVYMERVTGRAAFAMLGAPPLAWRNGVPRGQGTFRHAILLGSVMASFLPLYIGLWRGGGRRLVAALGATLCLVLVALTNSSGPLTSMAAALVGWAVWPLRQRMSTVRHAIVGVLVLLMIFMKAPIWYLPFKISAVVGGGGFHRGLLMERAWEHLGEWWLAGMDHAATASWFPYVHELVGGADVTNQFVVIGLRAGLLALGLFIAALSLAFSGLGRAMSSLRQRSEAAPADEMLLWALGVSLFVHAVSWLGVSYFDQSWVVWLLHVAAISAAMETVAAPEQAEAQVPSTHRRRAGLRPGASARPRLTAASSSPVRRRVTSLGDPLRGTIAAGQRWR